MRKNDNVITRNNNPNESIFMEMPDEDNEDGADIFIENDGFHMDNGLYDATQLQADNLVSI
jgi:hypothetical protein